MAITPDTNLKLLKCNLNLDEMNQINFSNATAQYNYFNSLPKLELQALKYIRKDGIIYYPAHIDSIIEYNYVMYQNHNYTNKWFYAYIVRMEYENDSTTRIYIKTDPYQTWQFNITFMRSFYEGDSNTTVCAMCSDIPDEVKNILNIKLSYYNGILNGCYILVFKPDDFDLNISNFLRAMDKLAKAEGVVSIFIVPNSLIEESITYSHVSCNVGSGHVIEFYCGALPSSNSAKLLATSSSFTVPSTLNGYTPKNNKLRTYPYSYFYASNFAGSDVEYHYEDFSNGSVSFKTIGSITPGCSIRCVPLNYKKLSDSENSTNSFNSGIPVAKYPICSWRSDVYINWLTENGINQAIQIAASGASIVGGLAGVLSTPFTGGLGGVAGVGAITAGVTGIANVLAQDYQHSLVPDQAKGNTNTGDVVFSAGHLDISVYKMSIRSEYAHIIDDFFSSFGYKVNSTKVPNITGRRNWNYIKCIDVNIEGYIPQEDLNEIKGMFNNGVTIWHNASTFLDYSQNNDII